MGISALIITKNEEERISDCLESIKWVDEIVLVDSYSSDRTVETAAKYTDPELFIATTKYFFLLFNSKII